MECYKGFEEMKNIIKEITEFTDYWKDNCLAIQYQLSDISALLDHIEKQDAEIKPITGQYMEVTKWLSDAEDKIEKQDKMIDIYESGINCIINESQATGVGNSRSNDMRIIAEKVQVQIGDLKK